MSKTPQKLRQLLVQEHAAFLKQIEDLKRFWLEVDELGLGPKFDELALRVGKLGKTLKDHFEEEERDGYLAVAIEVVPQYSLTANHLKTQHEQLVNALDDSIRRLQSRSTAAPNWQEARAELEEILKHLHEHEAAEMAIVQAALLHDVSSA